ncbi:hypothetical protein D9V29_07280 [Mycetocola manganoxydans]|uniref:DUF6993 domain-containing protein n=1 Tax=Mycetocola manganoxydans TaxID=699879 RepID=A0A3L6ZUW8_9MICO|nr:hypothetical protein [Mycetocola manganoxydans]RLP71650.1 hypothetical protein D9V29_07280 [Mycetocola manganoxydans]GHD38863.1 hypothetical protein GCM10008097_00940 [Mycetocola manganoxydans]
MRGTLANVSQAAMATAIAVLVLTGCSMQSSPSPATSGPGMQGSPTATPVPSFDPAAPVDDARIVFDSVNTATLAGNPDAEGSDFVDALSAAGFDRATMELTADETTIGNAADSIQFSVRWGESCLIGQNGPAVGGYHSTVAPVLGTGRCLIGSTRPIDW